MLVSKDYLLKVRPKILGVWILKKPSALDGKTIFGLTLEQQGSKNYVDECHLTQEELICLLWAGLNHEDLENLEL